MSFADNSATHVLLDTNFSIIDPDHLPILEQILITAADINDDITIYLDNKIVGRNTQCLGDVRVNALLSNFNRNSQLRVLLTNFGYTCGMPGFGVKNLQIRLVFRFST